MRRQSSSKRAHGSATMAGATALPTQFVEYHPSMSLERPTSMLELLAAPTEAVNESTGRLEHLQEPSRIEAACSALPPATLAAVLSQRGAVWSRVSDVIDRLAPHDAQYGAETAVLQRLLSLHTLCHILFIL